MSNDIIQGFLSIVQDDSSAYPRAQISYEGSNNIPVVRQSVYGVCSMPPEGSLGLTLKIDKMTGVRYAIFDDPLNRFNNLDSGEVQIGNYSTQASIKFDASGNVTIDVPDGDLTANVSGATNLTTDSLTINSTNGSIMNGNFTVNGNISANNFVSLTSGFNFNSHIHTGDSGGSTSSPVG